MKVNWLDKEFKAGSKFVDKDGNVLLLHSVGAMTMQFTYINSGEVYVQINTTTGNTLMISRDLVADGKIKDRILALTPHLLTDGENTESIKVTTDKERESLQNEIRIYLKDFSGAVMFNIKDPEINGEIVEQSETIKDFSLLIKLLLNIFVEGYNEIRDRKKFFVLISKGLQYLQDRIGDVLGDVLADSEHLYPDIVAKFFLENDGKVTLLISDEKEDVLQYEGHLQASDTVLSTKAMKYIIIPNLRDVLGLSN